MARFVASLLLLLCLANAFMAGADASCGSEVMMQSQVLEGTPASADSAAISVSYEGPASDLKHTDCHHGPCQNCHLGHCAFTVTSIASFRFTPGSDVCNASALQSILSVTLPSLIEPPAA